MAYVVLHKGKKVSWFYWGDFSGKSQLSCRKADHLTFSSPEAAEEWIQEVQKRAFGKTKAEALRLKVREDF